MSIHRRYSLVRTRFQQLAGDNLLHGEDDAIFALYSNGCSAVLDRFPGIFDLYNKALV